jgi:hypothetical protein
LGKRSVLDIGCIIANLEQLRSKNKQSNTTLSNSEPRFLSTGHTATSKSKAKRYPRLNGADVYVARLGSSSKPQANKPPNVRPPIVDTQSFDSLDSDSDVPVTRSTGSLHEELTISLRSKATVTSLAPASECERQEVRESRPCYRCVLYMQSVGIKRVFWTTDRGGWEGAKIRDLVDALEGTACNRNESEDSKGSAGMEIFVTKHEVLMMMRRLPMGVG